MLKDRLKVERNGLPSWTRIARVVFYGVAFLLVITSRKPSAPPQAYPLRRLLFGGHSAMFKSPGFEFGSLKPFLPQTGKVSFIMDIPYDPHDARMEPFCAAQAHLAPLVLTPFPSERVAIINCSNAAMAIRRSHETNYRIIQGPSGGKAIAVKQP
jgi:hypothetical protein